ncbi:hypothetical protein QBC47DRAFT_372651 [Echria macrotheca]|uniref:Nuclear transport factor 2 n=1 Tax=Echria macrotheca TaxID=438768 RepID=A0AAJ0BKJ2_9PEZI|nr:hypothetical protein QBC47DRAFT_372651 [Echria macrotheca]
MASPELVELATQFVTHYYTQFDADRKTLVGLYRDASVMTFQEQPSAGAAAIGQKLEQLPFQKVVHKFTPPDVQPTSNGGVLIAVLGQLVVDDGETPLNFSQIFILAKDQAGSWYVQNDIFKLVVF